MNVLLSPKTSRRAGTWLVATLTLASALASCSDGEPATADPTGVRLVSADDAAAVVGADPDDVVILDIRTPQEYGEGHLEGAELIDFYRDDFPDRLADLDPGGSYVLYCRSGNRSAQAAALMAEMGFVDVAEIDGGILAWAAAGLPLITP